MRLSQSSWSSFWAPFGHSVGVPSSGQLWGSRLRSEERKSGLTSASICWAEDTQGGLVSLEGCSFPFRSRGIQSEGGWSRITGGPWCPWMYSILARVADSWRQGQGWTCTVSSTSALSRGHSRPISSGSCSTSCPPAWSHRTTGTSGQTELWGSQECGLLGIPELRWTPSSTWGVWRWTLAALLALSCCLRPSLWLLRGFQPASSASSPSILPSSARRLRQMPALSNAVESLQSGRLPLARYKSEEGRSRTSWSRPSSLHSRRESGCRSHECAAAQLECFLSSWTLWVDWRLLLWWSGGQRQTWLL